MDLDLPKFAIEFIVKSHSEIQIGPLHFVVVGELEMVQCTEIVTQLEKIDQGVVS